MQTCVSVASQRQTLASCDRRIVAMGAVLSQYDDDNIEHPIGYYSRKLIDSETRWSIWELELGAVVWASTLCRPYLRGVHFELVTDSKVVAALLTKDTRPPRRENFIMEFDFTPVHRKGELNRNADFFSRWARYKNEDTRVNQPGVEGSSKMALGQTKAPTRNLYSSKEQKNITPLRTHTELQRILNDEPTEEEKKQHEIFKAYRDEQKAVDD